YVIFIFIYANGQLSLNGLGFEYVWSDYPLVWNKSVVFSLILGFSGISLFSRSFLATKDTSPMMNFIFNILMFITTLCAVLSLFIPYAIGVKMVAIWGLTVPPFALVAGIVSVSRKVPGAQYYLIAWVFFLLGIITIALRNFGLLPNMFITEYAVQIGSATEVVLLSLGLAYRINTMKKETITAQEETLEAQSDLVRTLTENYRMKDEMNKELEQKVEERTADLQKAMENLLTVNRQLLNAKDALWGEMQLAKKIQTTLLPPGPNISGYEISAFMEPAKEVGGDYYDIINTGDHNWVVIGDVSGHGVTAGIIMMMVQTSIHAILLNEPGLKPSVLISRINRVLAENIRKLKEDKYVTITVIACLRQGECCFSGLHQDMMIYRKETGTVEVIETDGILVGVLDSIDNTLSDSSFTLNRGDTLLLYTDGVTEAWEKGSVQGERDAENNMYGKKRLQETFEKTGDASPDEIKKQILASLKGYELIDDITLMILKRID
ncbi:MAG: SpoIIE family protein phosphatase, partial [bacterium]|nr:SpoIIE family protein phosphatase [bacterium]